MDDIEALRSEMMASVEQADSLDALEAIRVAELGKKGRITAMMKGLGGLEPDER